MDNLAEVSIKIKNFKCFGPEPAGFDTILPLNFIIGRNNSGKSSLLDLIAYGVTPSDLRAQGHRGQPPEVQFSQPLPEKILKSVFQQNSGSGPIDGNHWEFGKAWLGKRISWSVDSQKNYGAISLDPPLGLRSLDSERKFQEQLVSGLKPFEGRYFKRLSAARDIVPEKANSSNVAIYENGQGATNAIQCYLNSAALPSTLVERRILDALNKIIQPDATFLRIQVQLVHAEFPKGSGFSEAWEIFLHDDKGRCIALSQMGSGVKTILLVLINLILIPHSERHDLGDYVFGFEELENNLHPALQRRLFLYLREIVSTDSCILFLTTHSNVPIDMFSRDPRAQMVHVAHDGERASATLVTKYSHGKAILEDLDFKASDILQSNGIIWLEGPSDRIYVNRWIELFAPKPLIEGVHFQCMFYGGRLLSHLFAGMPEDDIDRAIQILRMNRNGIILIDSDRESLGNEINATKDRVVAEIVNASGQAWVTCGREVENYIPSDILLKLYPANATPIQRFESLKDWLEKGAIGAGKKFSRTKVDFAREITPHLTRADLEKMWDFSSHMSRIITTIKQWNATR